mmetsp:Transcript_36310/g.113114  ORF Transcript_36310/g.113114 Transcript_36310/m.113114 type:complete len:616 (-) Transcript_36310:48-1895(-)
MCVSALALAPALAVARALAFASAFTVYCPPESRKRCSGMVVVVGRRRHAVEVERRIPMHLHPLVVAMEVTLHRLEWMEGDLTVEARRHVAAGRRPLVAGPLRLQQQVESVNLGNFELLHAVSHEDILLAMLLGDLVASAMADGAILVGTEGLLREDLDRPMQAQLAIVQPHRRARLAVRLVLVLQHLLQAVGEEDGVRVDLDGPVVRPHPAIIDDPLPEPAEDRGVQSGLELAANLRLQCAVHDVRVHVLIWGRAVLQLHRFVAEHGPCVALEDAAAPLDVRPHHVHLVCPRQHEGEAEERRVGDLVLPSLGLRGRRHGELLTGLLGPIDATPQHDPAPGLDLAAFNVQTLVAAVGPLQHPRASVRQLEHLGWRAKVAPHDLYIGVLHAEAFARVLQQLYGAGALWWQLDTSLSGVARLGGEVLAVVVLWTAQAHLLVRRRELQDRGAARGMADRRPDVAVPDAVLATTLVAHGEVLLGVARPSILLAAVELHGLRAVLGEGCDLELPGRGARVAPLGPRGGREGGAPGQGRPDEQESCGQQGDLGPGSPAARRCPARHGGGLADQPTRGRVLRGRAAELLQQGDLLAVHVHLALGLMHATRQCPRHWINVRRGS